MEQCQLHGFIDTILPNASYVMVSSLHVFDSMIKAATPCKRTMSIYMVSIKVSMTQFHLMLVMYYRYMCLIIWQSPPLPQTDRISSNWRRIMDISLGYQSENVTG